MVKKLMKFFAYFFFFIGALAVFIPKSSVYYFLEQNIKQFEVVISNETLNSSIVSLNIENLEVSAKGIDSALIEEADITLLLFYNKLHFTNIKLSSIVEAYLPSKINNLEITYTLFNPLVVSVNAAGGFGDASGTLNIMERAVNITLKPSKKMLKRYKKSMRMLKKSENGEYVYAKTFK